VGAERLWRAPGVAGWGTMRGRAFAVRAPARRRSAGMGQVHRRRMGRAPGEARRPCASIARFGRMPWGRPWRRARPVSGRRSGAARREPHFAGFGQMLRSCRGRTRDVPQERGALAGFVLAEIGQMPSALAGHGVHASVLAPDGIAILTRQLCHPDKCAGVGHRTGPAVMAGRRAAREARFPVWSLLGCDIGMGAFPTKTKDNNPRYDRNAIVSFVGTCPPNLLYLTAPQAESVRRAVGRSTIRRNGSFSAEGSSGVAEARVGSGAPHH
jgi:hypothetical protein